MFQALRSVWARGGVAGFYQGLIPWVSVSLSTVCGLSLILNFGAQAWIEASTKGGVLLFTASEIESGIIGLGVNPAAAGLLGGMGGGIAQAYATRGESLIGRPPLAPTPPQCSFLPPRLLHLHEDGGDHAA